MGANTPKTTRRALIASAGVSAILGAVRPSAWAQPSDRLQDWLRGAVIPIRTVDPLDEDFSDLEPLIGLIGEARVVQLGEPSHGAGTSFSAKSRLVKFLHQRMGFDVLAWESGFYDVELTQAGLRAGADAVASAQRGVFKIWSASEQCRPLFEYARQTQADVRPLVMAGFDIQTAGAAALADFSWELRSFVGGVRDPALRRDASQAANDMLREFGGFSAYLEALAAGAADRPPLPRRDALERLQQAAARLTMLFDRERRAFAEIGGERRRGFMARAVTGHGGYAVNLHEKYSVEGPKVPQVVQSNRRDALMAENLRWLAEEGYPGQKIIVWAHNAHLMNAYYEAPDFKTVSLDPVPNAMKPVGVYLAKEFGDKIYTIGFTAYEGEDGLVGNPAMTIAPAREGGLEARLHRLGLAYAFLDMRAGRGGSGHPLRRPQTLRVPKYDEVEISDATRPYDALFYIARMKPATLSTDSG